MKAPTVHVRVSEIPEYARLYKAVHAYLVAGLLGEPKHPAYCELVDAHDAIAYKLLEADETEA